jgi:NAD(P)-dependent dehydrogenase (short-subunit alcohol dehydrogenase family)
MTKFPWTEKALAGRTALVTGASRGVGRGIAQVLGECGATVWVTGRSQAGRTTEGMRQTLDETAALVSKSGGRGVAHVVDHTDDGAVAALFETMRASTSRLDLVVNNVWGGYEEYDDTFAAPAWKQPVARFDRMWNAGLRAHYVTNLYAIPWMLESKGGLIISTSAGDGQKYRGSLPYDIVKTAIERMAWGLSQELKGTGVTSLAVQPGFARTERVLDHFDGRADHPELAATHTPQYVGRGIACLAADAQVIKRAGQVLMAGDLAKDYGFTDIDGRYVAPFRL